jgi:excisionase family DNA binding protein
MKGESMTKETTNLATTALTTQFYTIAELSRIMRVSYYSVYKMIRAGSIPAIKFGRAYRIKSEEAQRIFNEGVAP